MNQEQKWIYNGVEFQRGDKVIVYRIVGDGVPNAMGEVEWENCWIEAMNAGIGFEFEIAFIDERGAFFVDFVDTDPLLKQCFPDDEGYGWPLASLVLLHTCEIYG